MGLDMYVRDKTNSNICYWLEHNALHNWFAEEAIRQGIVESPEEFNCVQVPIDQEILDKLVKDIQDGKLQATSGFFFGSTDYDPKEYMKEDLKECAKIQEAIWNKSDPYYTSWW